MEKRDPMNMYKSAPKNKGQVITAAQFQAKKAKSEWQIQIDFCKWLKATYPEVKFRSDIQSAGKLSPQMQNIKLIIDPERSWPDIAVYLRRGAYVGLHIELKRLNSGTFLKDGSLSTQKHVQEQHEMHEFLRSLGYAVCFAEGLEKAKEMFLRYYNLPEN